MLGTSTIFFDESYSYKKYIDSKRNSYLLYADTDDLEESQYGGVTEYIVDAEESKYQILTRTISNFSEVWDEKGGHGDFYLSDSSRLSSIFVVEDKIGRAHV